jgi:hypothetical protein
MSDRLSKQELGACPSGTASPMLRTEPQASPPSGSVPTGAFAPAATVYDRNGRKLYFRRDLGDGTAIVSRWLQTEAWDGETESYVSDEPIIVAQSGLYPSPPTEALAAEVVDLSEKITVAHNQLSHLVRETRAAEVEAARVKQALTALAPLRNIERFIAGEITHFVVVNENYSRDFYGEVAVETFETAMTRFGERGRAEGMKLLSLFGDSKGDLSFRISQYGEGSGSWRTVIPCLSYEEAVAKAAEVLEMAWAVFDTVNHSYRIGSAVKSADALGLPVPEEIRAAWGQQIHTARLAAVEKAQEALDKAKAELAQVDRSPQGGNGEAGAVEDESAVPKGCAQ